MIQRRRKRSSSREVACEQSFRFQTKSMVVVYSMVLLLSCPILEYSLTVPLVAAFAPSSSTTATIPTLQHRITHHHRHYGYHQQQHNLRHQPRSSYWRLKSSIQDEEQWRAFRAKLVQNGLPSIPSKDNNHNNDNETNTQNKQNETNIRYAHETTPLVEVGTILLSSPTKDLCQALEQQYWHRAVVLITEVAEDVINGNEEDLVPDDQLAQGKNRGRWSYRGILLNRMTDLVLDGTSGDQMSQQFLGQMKQSGWNVHRGGDLLSLNSSNGPTEFTCLHHNDPKAKKDSNLEQVSTRLMGDLSFLSLEDAQRLCYESHNSENDSIEQDNTLYHPKDFFTYGGFCSWRPGQSELEMGEDREEWHAISVDPHTILQQIQQQYDEAKMVLKFSYNDGSNISQGLLESGTQMWKNFFSLIDISETKATERLPVGQLEFYDQMLNVWAQDNLQFNTNGNNNNYHENFNMEDSSHQIRPGTLLRSKLPISKDMLLYEPEFIRSLILVLEETDSATVGIMLNHPLKGAVECVKGKIPLPLRYGGPIDLSSWKDGSFLDEISEDEDTFDEDDNYDGDDEMYEGFLDYQNGIETDLIMNEDGNSFDVYEDAQDDEDDELFLWIHRDVALGSQAPEKGGGTRLGTSDVWLIQENDALKALQSGLLSLKDTMVFSGVCIWEKKKNLGMCGGGLREQVDALQSFEIVPSGSSHEEEGILGDPEEEPAMERVWDILGDHQNVLENETLEANIQATMDAWESCNAAVRHRYNTNHPTANRAHQNMDLSDAALRAWVGVNLLLDPLGTLVEVGNRTISR